MFVHKNLIREADMLKRNGLLKGLALFLLGASAVLLFSSADLILNPYISNSYVYLQKMFFSPNGTSNTVATISLDGGSGSITATSVATTTLTSTNFTTSVLTASVANITDKVNTSTICDASQTNCFSPSTVAGLSGSVASLSGLITQLQQMVSDLSGRVSSYHP